jgi:hypothetical protein
MLYSVIGCVEAGSVSQVAGCFTANFILAGFNIAGRTCYSKILYSRLYNVML